MGQPISDSRSRTSFAEPADLDLFVEMLEKFERGEISADAWRAFRLVHGTYGQRQNDSRHMLRVKIPQGVLRGEQLEALAEVAETASRGFGHVSTRQNIQFHFVELGDVEEAMRRLAAAGLTTREACGNSVRNITACPLAGVYEGEVFDPTPYAEALTRHLLRHPLSSSLPRKFKIAFEGCPVDHVSTPIHDIGLTARFGPDGSRGFLVTAGGGTSTLPASGQVLREFLPAGELLAVAEAIVRVFHRMGDRQNRHANRMKFLIRKIGFPGFRAEVERELVEVEGRLPLPFDPDHPPVEEAPRGARPPPPGPAELAERVSRQAQALRGPGIVPAPSPARDRDPARLAAWLKTNARAQRQPGFSAAFVTLELGDVTAGQLRALAALAAAYGDGTVRTTREQNFVLRWVRSEDLAALHERLDAAGLGDPGAGTVADVVSCPGAESCRLAVTQSRGLGRLLSDHVRAHPEIAALAPDLELKVSGCPNGCGQHHIAGIGFQGSARKLGGKVVPQYFVLVGGATDASGARFGRLAAKIPARRMPQALDRLLALYCEERRPGETATAFFGRLEPARAKAALAQLEALSPEEARPEDHIDLGETAAYRPETQEGECAV